MAQVTARIRKGGKHFEILVDEEEAFKLKRKGSSDINSAVLTDMIFYNLKSGEQASKEDLEKNFGTSDFLEVAAKIIYEGEIEKTIESVHAEQEKKYKQVVDFLSRNAVSPDGRPYTSERIMKALNESKVNIKNRAIETQIDEIIDQISKILPLKIEKKRVRLVIPAIHTGKSYGVVKEFMIEEKWKENGDLETIVEMPTALIFDFYDKINSATHGSVLSEELK